jgi:hypothetical protein
MLAAPMACIMCDSTLSFERSWGSRACKLDAVAFGAHGGRERTHRMSNLHADRSSRTERKEHYLVNVNDMSFRKSSSRHGHLRSASLLEEIPSYAAWWKATGGIWMKNLTRPNEPGRGIVTVLRVGEGFSIVAKPKETLAG